MKQSVPKVFGFDVFGTVVDWRTSVSRETAAFLARIGRPDIRPDAFADTWRMRYLEVMGTYARSGRDFVTLDVLHREMLDSALAVYAVDVSSLAESALDDFNRSWHRLDAWADSRSGIERLRTLAPVTTLTNGNIAMMIAIARRNGIVWDAVLGAEVSGFYKPDRAAYLRTAAILGVAAGDLCLIASHHADLAAARACGLATAYIDRPHEFGGAAAPDRAAAQDWDWSCGSIEELAEVFGA